MRVRRWKVSYGRLGSIGAGALAHTLVAWAHGHVEAWLGSLITQCMPVAAAIAAWIALDEPLTPLVALGGVIVVAATATLAVGASRRARREPVSVADDAGPRGVAAAAAWAATRHGTPSGLIGRSEPLHGSLLFAHAGPGRVLYPARPGRHSLESRSPTPPDDDWG